MIDAFAMEPADFPGNEETFAQETFLPSEKKNLITPDGFRRLREELSLSMEEKRPKILALTNERVREGLLQMVDRRCLEIQENLRSAEIVPPPSEPVDEIRFGATIKVRALNGEETKY